MHQNNRFIRTLRSTITTLYICSASLSGAQPIADTIISVSSDSIPTDDNTIRESIHGDHIKTVLLNRTDLQLGYPMLLLGSSDQLELSFDDLKGDVTNYSYTFVHCNRNWEPSGLSYFDYLDGFEENYMTDYDFSFATSQQYTHYRIAFPNDDIQFRESGNYAIYVWAAEDRTTPVIVRHFFVWEDLAVINGSVYRPNLIAYRNEFQEINFTVDIKNLSISNPYDEVRVVVMQNGRYDNAIVDLKPRLVNNVLLTYDQDDIVFPAGKEYRRFDLKTLNFQSDRIRQIERVEKQYHAYINIDESRSFSQYYYEKDLNGQFVLQADQVNDISTEGDYAWVHFTLQYPYFITSGKFYIFGELTSYEQSPQYEMTYDFDKQQYSASLYLKQGYYNYMYAFRNIDQLKTDLTYAEGNHFETENDYLILAYQHYYDRDYDKLIGISVINSLKK